MNSRICSTGQSSRVSGWPGRRCPVMHGRGAAGPVQDGGWSQPASLVHGVCRLVTPPVYSKNWMRSLQTAGAFAYLPQSSEGAPSACGPVNAFGLGQDRRRGQVRVADLVHDLDGRQRLTEVDDVPRVGLVRRGGELLRHRLVGRHARVGRVAEQRARDRVRPVREVTETLDDLPVEAQRRRDDLLGIGDAQRLEALGEVHAAGGVAVRDHHVGRLRARRGEHRGQVGLGLRVTDRLDGDAGRHQPGLDRRGALGDAGVVRRVDERRGLGVQDVLRVRAERRENVGHVAEQDHRVLLHGIDRGRRDAVDHRQGAAQRGVERLHADRHAPQLDHVDLLVGEELLRADRALFLGRGDEAGDKLDRVAVDAAEIGVGVVDRHLRAGGGQQADGRRAALLVDEADVDRRQRLVRRAGRATDVALVVGHRLGAQSAGAGAGREAAGRRRAGAAW